jgi:hypothetical protein
MMADDWSVLVKARGPEGSAPLSKEQSEGVLGRLPTPEGWIQYPPTSGRGHGTEVRFWVPGEDACLAGAAGVEWFERVRGDVGLDGWIVSRVHSASVYERSLEVSIGLERRMADRVEDDWNCAIRAIAGEHGAQRLLAVDLAAFLDLLPGPDRHGYTRDGMVEARFWVMADDAVEASQIGRGIFTEALMRIGHGDWTIIRAQAASVAERGREIYLGVERRLAAANDA